MSLHNQVRVERSRDDLGAFSARFDEWLGRRRKADPRRQYTSQLDAIERCIRRATAAIDAALVSVDAERPASSVYDECRVLELRLLWLQRVWEFFRTKFDQRDDPVMGPLLRAADEVVWSAYRPVFDRCQALGVAARLGPAPLPFVEFEHSPAAFPSSLVPPGLKRDVDGAVLAEFLDTLPVPVVRLPPSCTQAPWWLIHLGHEVGHHLQYDLADGQVLVRGFQDLVRATVEEGGANEDEADRWAGWSREIFADISSVALMGPLAVHATVEFEITSAPELTKPRPLYPSPYVRAHFLAAIAERLKLPAPELLALLDAGAAGAVAANDVALARRVAAVATGALPGLGRSLAELVDLRRRDYGSHPTGAVNVWFARMRDTQSVNAPPQLRSARLATTGAYAAWRRITAEPDASKRADARHALATRSRALIAACAPEGTREAHAGLPPPLVDRFVAALMKASGALLAARVPG